MRLPWASEDDLRRVLAEQNPWHDDGRVPPALAPPTERGITDVLWQRLLSDTPRRFQLILGPRRVGKTTAMYQTVQRLLDHGTPTSRLWWLRLDHPLLMTRRFDELVRSVVDASGATPDAPVFLFLDELTYAERWDLWLKTLYDERWPVRVAGTSSSTAALRTGTRESGVGRWEEHFLAPYLFHEFLALVGAPPPSLPGTLAETLTRPPARPPGVADRLDAFLLTGGFPELLLAQTKQHDLPSSVLRSQQILKGDAIERAIYKDIPQAFRIDNPALLERLLYTLAGQATGILSPQGICQQLGGLTQPTFDKYLAYLQQVYLVFTLPNYSSSEAKVQKRGRKLYFVDGAIRSAALQRGLAPLHDPRDRGVLLENAVAGHLFALSQHTQTRLFHWREEREEVDLVLDDPNRPLAFEIATSQEHHRQGLRALTQRHPRFRGGAYLAAPRHPFVNPAGDPEGIGAIAIEDLLVLVGLHSDAALRQRLL